MMRSRLVISACAATLLMLISQSAKAATDADGLLATTTTTTPTAISGRNPFTGTVTPTQNLSAPIQGHISPVSGNIKLVLSSGNLLSQDIKTWAEQEGYKLLWQSKSDYLIYSSIVLSGKDNDEILNELGKLFSSENYGLFIKKYQQNHVLIIDDM